MEVSFITQLGPVFAPSAQQTLQVELVWAIIIAAGLLLVGAFLGTTIGFIIAGRDMRHARSEAHKMREMRDLAETAHTLALTERERAVNELQEKQQQLDTAHLSLQQRSDELQQKLAASVQAQNDQQATITQLQAEFDETQSNLNDARARVTYADNATSEMQAAMQSMESLLQFQRTRLAYSAHDRGGEADISAPITRDQRLEQMQAQLDSILERLPSAMAASVPSTDMTATAPEPDTIGLPEPADELRLEDVKGIGANYAQRLRAAGIETMSELAVATPDQLDAIIKAPAFRKPDYAGWINTAQKMMSK